MEFYSLGLGEPYPISALHGTGAADLLDSVVAALDMQPEEEDSDVVRVAIVGRTNVGKSSLLNALLGQERVIVSEIPGTTRDAIDTQIKWEGRPLVLIDTAGIRRRGSVKRGVEQYSVLRALKAISRAHVALLLLDASEGVTTQDAHISGYVLESMKSLVVVVNKWDLVDKDSHTMDEYTTYIRRSLRHIPYVPVVFISALTRQRIHQVLDAALLVREQRLTRIPTGELNRIVEDAVARHAPPSKWGKRLRFYYATQGQTDPPTIVFFVNDIRLVHFSYKRYLANQIRQRFPFTGTPLRLRFRSSRGRG